MPSFQDCFQSFKFYPCHYSFDSAKFKVIKLDLFLSHFFFILLLYSVIWSFHFIFKLILVFVIFDDHFKFKMVILNKFHLYLINPLENICHFHDFKIS
jgi:hypothetical protein